MDTTPGPLATDTTDHPPDRPTAPSAGRAVDGSAVPVARVAGVLAVRPLLILALGLGLLAAGSSLLLANALVVLVDLAALAVLALAMRAEGRRLRDLFAPWRWVDLAWGALLLVILVVGFLAANFIANLIVYGGAPPLATSVPDVPLWAGLVAAAIAPLTIAVAEEAVYRGYAQPRLGRRIGTVGALVVVAVVFALQHAGFALTSGPDLAAKVLTTLLAGLVLGALWLWMRRLAPLILAHWGLDLLLLLGLPTLMIALA